MSPSPNYKKKIHASTLYSYPDVDYFILEEYTDLSSLQDVPAYQYKTHLLDSQNKFVIKDKETLKEASYRFFYYHRYDKTIYSIYKLTTSYLKNANNIFYSPENVFINCVIMIISGDDCAIGCYHEGEMVAHRRFHRDKSHSRRDDNMRGSGGMNLRRHSAKEMDYDIRSLLSTWNHLLKPVKVVFYQGVTAQHDGILSYFNDLKIPVEELPFQTVAKTGGIKNAYDELFQVTCHGTVQEFFEDLEENTVFKNSTILDPTNCVFVSSVKGERRLEKQNFPSLNPDIKQRLHDALQNDDYNALMDIHESHKNKDELVQYLSIVHSKLNEQTFLHYAVRDNLPRAVQALLEIGCNPQTKDRNGKVACELADKNVREVFINFRLDNPLLYNWTKCHIPEPSASEEEHSIKWKDAKEAQRRKVKEQRKAKRESKKVVY